MKYTVSLAAVFMLLFSVAATAQTPKAPTQTFSSVTALKDLVPPMGDAFPANAKAGTFFFISSGVDSGLWIKRPFGAGWVRTGGAGGAVDTVLQIASKQFVINQSYTRNADTSTMLGGYVRGSLTAGQLPFANGTRSVAGSANLFWDNANSRLGVGTSSPTTNLHVPGGASFGNGNVTFTTNSQNINAQGVNGSSINFAVNNNYTGTANHFWVNIGGSQFAPTSGSGQHAALSISHQINQTGTASGQVSGITVTPSLTSVGSGVFYRGLSISIPGTEHYGIFQTGATSRNYLQGRLGIGTSTPNSSAALDISANDKGVLIPRLTSTEATTNIASPANGLMYYNTDSLRLMIRRSGQWRGVRFTDEGGGGASLPAGNNLDILRNRGGTWVAEPDSLTMNGLVNITGSRLLEYSGAWRTASLNDSSVLSKRQIDSLLAAGNGQRVLYSTSNSTPVNALVQNITNNTAGQIEVSVTVTSGAGAIKIIRRSFGFKKIAGTLTLITPWDLISPYADSGMSSADINLVNSSNNAGVQVTGIGSSLDWSIEIKFVATVNIPV